MDSDLAFFESLSCDVQKADSPVLSAVPPPPPSMPTSPVTPYTVHSPPLRARRPVVTTNTTTAHPPPPFRTADLGSITHPTVVSQQPPDITSPPHGPLPVSFPIKETTYQTPLSLEPLTLESPLPRPPLIASATTVKPPQMPKPLVRPPLEAPELHKPPPPPLIDGSALSSEKPPSIPTGRLHSRSIDSVVRAPTPPVITGHSHVAFGFGGRRLTLQAGRAMMDNVASLPIDVVQTTKASIELTREQLAQAKAAEALTLTADPQERALLWRLALHGYSNGWDVHSPEIRTLVKDALVGEHHCRPGYRPPETDPTALAHVQNLLLEGKREEACRVAMNGGYWEHALTLAVYIDTGLFKTVLQEFMQAHYQPGAPMRCLFSLLLDPFSLFKDENRSSLIDRWRENLAMIVANSAESEDSLLKIGELLYFDDRPKQTAGQLCYLLADYDFTLPQQGTRGLTMPVLSLAGADIAKYRGPPIDGVLVSQMIQTAKATVNPQYVAPSLPWLSLSLVHALADCGYTAKAMELLASLEKDADNIELTSADSNSSHMPPVFAAECGRLAEQLTEAQTKGIFGTIKSLFRRKRTTSIVRPDNLRSRIAEPVPPPVETRPPPPSHPTTQPPVSQPHQTPPRKISTTETTQEVETPKKKKGILRRVVGFLVPAKDEEYTPVHFGDENQFQFVEGKGWIKVGAEEVKGPPVPPPPPAVPAPKSQPLSPDASTAQTSTFQPVSSTTFSSSIPPPRMPPSLGIQSPSPSPLAPMDGMESGLLVPSTQDTRPTPSIRQPDLQSTDMTTLAAPPRPAFTATPIAAPGPPPPATSTKRRTRRTRARYVDTIGGSATAVPAMPAGPTLPIPNLGGGITLPAPSFSLTSDTEPHSS